MKKSIAAITLSLLAAATAATGTANAGTLVYGGSVVANAEPIQVIANNGFQNRNYVSTDAETKFTYDSINLNAFCIEVYQNQALSAQYSASLWADGSLTQRLISRLYGNFYDANKLSAAGTSALQAVIWEVVEDPTNLSFTDGKFILGPGTSAAVLALATQFLSAIQTLPDSSAFVLTRYTSPINQDLVSAVRSQVVPVPLPASAALLGLGLFGLGLFNRGLFSPSNKRRLVQKR